MTVQLPSQNPKAPFRVQRIKWAELETLKMADDGTHDGLQSASRVVLEATNMIVPFDTGELMGSGTVDWTHDGEQASVYYDTVYAAKLHQNPGYNFQNGRRGKFLQSALNGSKSRVHQMFGERMKVRFSRGRIMP